MEGGNEGAGGGGGDGGGRVRRGFSSRKHPRAVRPSRVGGGKGGGGGRGGEVEGNCKYVFIHVWRVDLKCCDVWAGAL